MNCLTEALGMGLPGNGTVPAVFSERLRLAKKAGMQIMEVLKQGQYSPYKVEEQVISFYCVTNGFFDDVPTEKVRQFERELIDALSSKTIILKQILEKKQIDDEIKNSLNDFIQDFKEEYVW